MEKQITLMDGEPMWGNFPYAEMPNKFQGFFSMINEALDENKTVIASQQLNPEDYLITMLFDPTDDPHIKDRHPQTLEPLDYE